MSDELSAKMRNYLAEIYRLADRHSDSEQVVTTSMLADDLDVSAPAVNRMVNRLKEMNLLNHQPYKGIHLTPEGEKLALRQLRYHRLAERFFIDVMEFEWDEIYDEAHRVSMAMNDMLADRMEEMTDSHAYCPHGEPIPTADGMIEDMHDILLSNTTAGQRVRVTRFRTREEDRLEYIEALGLLPGIEVEILHLAPFDGPMQLKVGDEYRIIGHSLAELIRAQVIK